MKEIVSRDVLVGAADGSIYKLVVLAIKRALELAGGAPRLVEADLNLKSTTVALMEISQGKIRAVPEKK